MIVYKFLGMYIRGQGLPRKATNIDRPRTMMISQYMYMDFFLTFNSMTDLQ